MLSLHGNHTLRVLAIPELLDMIFRFLDNASNVSNARVCKRWSDVALDVLWEEVTDMTRLLSLLAPVRDGIESPLKFLRPLQPSDWKTFDRYRRRVRSLSYHSFRDRSIHQKTFDEVARSRTSLDILPNMQTLEWNGPLQPCVIFMHKNVKSFAVTLPDPEDDSHLTTFLRDVGERMPNLIHLDLRLNYGIGIVEHNIIELLSSLHNLRKMTLPRLCFTSKIAEAASCSGNLEVIEFQYFESQGIGSHDDVANFDPSLNAGAYQSLYELSISISFRNAAAFLVKPFSPTNLKVIFFDSPVIELPAGFSELVSTIAEHCQLLKSLSLVSCVRIPDISSDEPYDKTDCITIDHLRPLFKCPNLVHLDVTHPYPLQLQLRDIEEIAIAWPSVEHLVLNSEPYYMSHSDLTLSALLPFAWHCPKLRALGLFLNATTIDIEPVSHQYTPYPTFRSLRQLFMGVSLIKDEGATALFLSQICPLGCTVESGVTWSDSLTAPFDTWLIIKERYDGWDKVDELLPLLTKLRMEEKERGKLLRREVEDLRMRTSVLMDSDPMVARLDGCITV